MTETTMNPFKPVEIWDEIVVKVREGEEEKPVDAKHYHVRYMVGESEDKRFVDSGRDSVEPVHGKTLFIAPSVHKVHGEPFHYDVSAVQRIALESNLDGRVRELNRAGQCQDHPLVEVAYQSAQVECCAMTKEDADKQTVPMQYLAGYVLGRKDGTVKIALAKTVLESGVEYYENIHIIPEAIVQSWTCLE
ncbi:MAG: hypothetical protein HXY34_10955 [Candidatus Thorarchaeota archaeon]|nr:hypothetical protein [Candidatus Thorarchaeota archaeon]